MQSLWSEAGLLINMLTATGHQHVIQCCPFCPVQDAQSCAQLDKGVAGMADNNALKAVCSSFVHTQQAHEQKVKETFQEALVAEQQGLLLQIEHMHA